MNNKISHVVANETHEWSYPDIKYINSITLDMDEKQIEAQKELDEKLKKQNEEHQAAMDVLCEKQKEYEKKIAVLDSIIKGIENPLHLLNDDILDLLKNIIENSVKKIILREIQVDPQIIIDLVDELKLLITPENSLVIVYLSEADYNLINLKEANASLSFRINKELASGDLIIKSNVVEVRSILNDRIDKFLGKKS